MTVLKKNTGYVVVTPAFNEEKFIHYPIDSIINQTVKPLRWIIVDDESTDHTAQIINNKIKKFDWITYVYNQKKIESTYYSSNVYAILEGINIIKNINYSYLAILDADIELCNDYYEKIIEKFEKYQDLGIATGTYLEKEGDGWIAARIDRRSTPKAIQVFRRECYESTPGYIPFRHGGEDSGMEIMARMNGWKTWSFETIVVKHHRPVGTGDGRSLLLARFRLGLTDYCLGSHPFFMVFKCLKRALWERPLVISGVCRLLGFLSGYVRRVERQLPAGAITFLRKEQMQRLFALSSANWKFE